MAIHIQRRKFIGTVGSAIAWPLAARAQQPPMPVIGFLRPGSPESVLLNAFRAGLRAEGFVESQNVAIEYRWTEGQEDRLPDLVLDDFVQRQVAVIVTPGSTTFALAAKAATKTIPIVFASGIDPIESGLVASLNKPGGNVTGIYELANDLLTAKRFEILHELVPNITVLAALVNPANAIVAKTTTNELRAAATALRLEVKVLEASSSREIDAAFFSLVQQRVGAVLVSADPYFTSRRVQFATLANRAGIPAMFSIREYVEVGGLMSYGNNIAHVWRRVGVYAGRILKGEKNLPVEQSTKFEFVINLQTAKALGLEVPPMLLARADEVIE
jgi:putative ABC transport system substrate-binding protein